MNDPILFWNDAALEANRVSHTNGAKEQTGPTASARALAIVHLAMYDAYAAIDTAAGLTPYLSEKTTGAPANSPENIAAGVAGAAYTALVAFFPSQKDFFDMRLMKAGDPMNPAHQFGARAAQNILLFRRNDPLSNNETNSSYMPSQGRGKHRPDPDNPSQGFYGVTHGAAKLFASNKYELDEPPFDNAVYLKALEQVRVKGIQPELTGALDKKFNSKIRTSEETLIGIFWGYDGARGLGTPPRLYNQIIRKIIEHPAVKTTTVENAVLFAMVNVAMADAGIQAWREKYRHEFWRPVVGIREHHFTMGPRALHEENKYNDDFEDGDPFWLPLGAPATNSTEPLEQEIARTTPNFPFNTMLLARPKNFTPNFPAYPSGHATFGAAAFRIAELFLREAKGQNKLDEAFQEFTFVSEELNGVNKDNRGAVRPRHVRRFPNFDEMIKENGISRIYLGVHWIFDAYLDEKNPLDINSKTGGIPLGLNIAKEIFERGLKPVDEPA